MKLKPSRYIYIHYEQRLNTGNLGKHNPIHKQTRMSFGLVPIIEELFHQWFPVRTFLLPSMYETVTKRCHVPLFRSDSLHFMG